MGVKKGGDAVKERLTTYERRDEIRLILVKDKFTTTKYLTERFGVSKWTILNDIVFLSGVIPLETYPGNGGGIFLKMEYNLPKAYLSAEEESLLLRLLESLCETEKRMIISIVNKFSMPGKN